MADLHPEVLALIEAGPTAEEWEHWGEHGNFVPFARRIALRAVEIEREEERKQWEEIMESIRRRGKP